MKNEIIELLKKHKELEVEKAVDFTKFNNYLVSHHSTSIEGSTLTYIETTVLLDEGLTPKGKPLVHTLMQKDHYEALTFTLNHAESSNMYTPEFIKLAVKPRPSGRGYKATRKTRIKSMVFRVF